MKITNLQGNVIPWDFSEYPDGQLQFRIDKKYTPLNSEGKLDPVDIIVSVPNPAMLDLFNQAKFLLPIKTLNVNYFYGARSDKNESGDYRVTNVANMFFENIFMDLKRTKITFLAPHCEIFEFANVKTNFVLPDCINLDKYDLVVFPDESAQKRFSEVKKMNAVCEKHRDQESGKIIAHNVPTLPDDVKKVILLDDLCDHGTTFVNVAKTLPRHVTADLFIFHGVFSHNGLDNVLQYFNHVIVSNSLPNAEEQKANLSSVQDRVTIFDVWR